MYRTFGKEFRFIAAVATLYVGLLFLLLVGVGAFIF